MPSNSMEQTPTLTKSYSELIALGGYGERLEYLRLYSNNPGNEDRKVMNHFYKSKEWLDCRKSIIIRDFGCDLGVDRLPIPEGEAIFVHHINPITAEDVLRHSPLLLDPENLITVRADTHNAIHYRERKDDGVAERKPGDTILW